MPEIVSADTNSKIDIRILVGIATGVILFQMYLEFVDSETDVENLAILFSILATFLIGTASIFVAKKHGTSKFALAFYSLSVAFFSIIIAEIIYYYFSVIDIDPFPSIADLFYFLLYPFTMIHLVINIDFYQEKCTLKSKITMTSLAVSIISVYAYYAFDYFGAFDIDFFYGLIFVSGAACITSVGLYGAIVARKIPLGRAWFLLVGGIVLGTVADVWYYGVELVETYTLDNIINLFWYASYLIIIYSLYKHYKIM